MYAQPLIKLAEAGVNSFKIEGRAKSSYYVSVITNAYRKAMDIYKSDPKHFELPQWLKDEVFKVSHRAYCTGFFSLVTQRRASITKTAGIFVNMMLWLWLTVVAVEEYTVLKKTNSTRATRLKCFHLLVAL